MNLRMTRILLSIVVALPLFSLLLAGHPAEGSWKAEFTDPRGNQRSVTFRFKVSEDRLDGTVVLGRESIPIEDGEVEGEALSFRVTLPVGEMDLELLYKGRLQGDTLHLVQETRGGTRELTARRVE